jgi:hypothetical protein
MFIGCLVFQLWKAFMCVSLCMVGKTRSIQVCIAMVNCLSSAKVEAVCLHNDKCNEVMTLWMETNSAMCLIICALRHVMNLGRASRM